VRLVSRAAEFEDSESVLDDTAVQIIQQNDSDVSVAWQKTTSTASNITISHRGVTASVNLPSNPNTTKGTGAATAVAPTAFIIVYYEQSASTAVLFPDQRDASAALSSPVVSVSFGGVDADGTTAATELEGELIITLAVEITNDADSESNDATSDIRADEAASASQEVPDPKQFTCVWWDYNKIVAADVAYSEQDYGDGGWSEDGCRLVSVSSDLEVTCACTHLTHFAVLFTNSDRVRTRNQDAVLEYVTWVGTVIGFIGFVLVWMTFAVFSELVHRPEMIIVHLTIAVAAGLALFVGGTERKDGQSDGSCRAVASVLHYLLLAGWSWQVCEGVHLYKTFVKVLGKEVKFFHYVLAGWGAPLLFVVPAVAAWPDDYGYDGTICFMRPHSNAMWFFVVPSVICLIVNFIICVTLMRSIQAVSTTTKSRVLAAATFGTTMGLAYIFGAALLVRGTFIIEVVFALFVGLQGLFIFYFHVYVVVAFC
jgi:hypothetical protein